MPMGVRRGHPISPEPEFQVVLSCPMWMLGTKFFSVGAGAASPLSHRAIPPAPSFGFFGFFPPCCFHYTEPPFHKFHSSWTLSFLPLKKNYMYLFVSENMYISQGTCAYQKKAYKSQFSPPCSLQEANLG